LSFELSKRAQFVQEAASPSFLAASPSVDVLQSQSNNNSNIIGVLSAGILTILAVVAMLSLRKAKKVTSK
jgi:hypothetical protein